MFNKTTTTQPPKLKKITKKYTTQEYLNISAIQEDTVILKDGTIAAVLLASSINFALKSSEEQEAIIQGYISFLNSISFPLQIVIQSRKLNIDPYIDKLKKIEKEQTNELLRMQIVEYHNYITELVKIGEIMTKRFYVVVTYSPFTNSKKGFFKKLGEALSPASLINLRQDIFLKRRHELFQRIDTVVAGLNSMGVNSAILDTESLIELYYNTYNPDVSLRQILPNLNEMQIEK